MIDLWIVGAGGHARVIYDTAISTGTYTVRAFIDDDPGKWSDTMYGLPIIGPIDAETIGRYGVTCAVMGIGNNTLRAAMLDRLRTVPAWATLVHRRAHVAIDVVLGAGTVIFAGSIVQTGSVIGDHVIVNTNSTVDHDTHLEDFCHIASARIGGRARIGTGAMIGIGGVVIPDVCIGPWSMLGAGAVATRDVPPGALAVGVPAVVKKSGAAVPASDPLPLSSVGSHS
jgi:sugar O-acyltransferase (sialic acid O-acetyltransferase NeuD family)